MARAHMLIGIAGGTGSGKTLVTREIVDGLGTHRVVTVALDNYYRDFSHLPLEERHRVNFDHPDAFDIDLLIEHLEILRDGQPIQMPVYDYVEHVRTSETIAVCDHRVVMLEGILVFAFARLRELMDIKIYVETPADIRLARRLRRDISDRGRDLEGALEQYENSVRPMHESFIEPSKRYADVIVPRGGENAIAIDLISTKIRQMLQDLDGGS